MSLNTISAKLKITRRFLNFWRNAKSIDSVDSPLLYDLCTKIKDGELNKTHITQIEKRREALLTNETIINRESLGATSTVHAHDEISISQIARSAVSPQYKCTLLSSLIEWSGATKILELGTSLAISTSYIAIGSSVDHVDTVEGSSSISAVNSQDEHSQKILFHNQSFQSFIDVGIDKGSKYDCIVLDGHHELEPTLSYVRQFRQLLKPAGVIIMDDIYWSQGMTKAWQELKSSQDYNLSIDLFFYGVLSMKPSIRESVDVKLWPFKSRWQLGLFR